MNLFERTSEKHRLILSCRTLQLRPPVCSSCLLLQDSSLVVSVTEGGWFVLAGGKRVRTYRGGQWGLGEPQGPLQWKPRGVGRPTACRPRSEVWGSREESNGSSGRGTRKVKAGSRGILSKGLHSFQNWLAPWERLNTDHFSLPLWSRNLSMQTQLHLFPPHSFLFHSLTLYQVSIDQCFLQFHINGIIQHTFFWAWLLPLNILSVVCSIQHSECLPHCCVSSLFLFIAEWHAFQLVHGS